MQEFSPTFRKPDQFVMEHLCVNDSKSKVENTDKTKKYSDFSDYDKNIGNFYRSNSLPMKAYPEEPKN